MQENQNQRPLDQINYTPNQLPLESSSKYHTFFIGGLLLMMPIIAIMGYYLGKQSQANLTSSGANHKEVKSEVQATPTPITEIEEKSSANQYINEEYSISFDVLQNERVVECPNINESNNHIALWIVNTPRLEGIPASLDCATEAPPNALLMSKMSAGPQAIEDRIQLLEGEGYNYVLTKTPVTISGISGIQLAGDRDTTIPAPIPASVDEMVFVNKGAFYIIPTSYKTRNFTFAN